MFQSISAKPIIALISLRLVNIWWSSKQRLMSEEQLKAFISKLQSDTTLQEQLKAKDADIVGIAKAAGFSITTENLTSLRQRLSGDLSAQELESAAGGAGGLTGLSVTCTYKLFSWWDCE